MIDAGPDVRADVGPRTEPRRFLLIKAKGGFGNRILSAATGIALAELSDRTAVIDWRDGEYLPAGTDAYRLLFESPVSEGPEDFDECRDVAPAIWRGRIGSHPVDVISELFPNAHSSPFIYRRLSINLGRPQVPDNLAVFWSYLPKMFRLWWPLYRSRRFRGRTPTYVTRWALARYFTPQQRIRDQVSALFADQQRPIIGVHIRYTDRKVSLDRIFEEVADLRRRLPAALIFLATDNRDVQQQFCDRFTGVFVIKKVLGDAENSLHEQMVHADPLREADNALIDMWALSSCDWLIHSRHSTFSVAAALIGGIPRSRQRDIDRHNVRVVLKRWLQAWA